MVKVKEGSLVREWLGSVNDGEVEGGVVLLLGLLLGMIIMNDSDNVYR